LAFFLFDAIRMVMLGVQVPKTFARDVEEDSVSQGALEESPNSTLSIEETHQQMVAEKLEVGSDEKSLIN
jgi:hypothetical protein